MTLEEIENIIRNNPLETSWEKTSSKEFPELYRCKNAPELTLYPKQSDPHDFEAEIQDISPPLICVPIEIRWNQDTVGFRVLYSQYGAPVLYFPVPVAGNRVARKEYELARCFALNEGALDNFLHEREWVVSE